jgi:hypothetical protein
MDTGLNDDVVEGMVPVELPSGAIFHVHDLEAEYFKKRAEKYLSDNDFQNMSDFQDVDRLLILELLCMRWGMWVSMQRDYWGEGVDENALQKSLKEHSSEIRQLKKSLGLDRESREKVRGENSVDTYLARLRERALHFGYMRNKQSAASIELFMDLDALITLHDNCDERERIELGVQTEDVLRWIRDTAIPRFRAIDEEFRKEQTTWIREM